MLGQPLAEVLPELGRSCIGAQLGPQRLAQGQVTISRNGRERNLSVRVTSEQSPRAEHGYVVTLDDITELVAAQRTSAWADVARRIAHEIKNPLTPIQLSAERLRRKYGKVIVDDPRACSTNAPTRSCARSTTSSAWSTSSRASRACRSR